MTDDKLNQIHENLTNQVSVYIRGIISKYGEYMVPAKVEYLKSIKDYSKIVKIYDYGSINGYANSDGIYMPLCADKVLEKVSKIPGYGINKKHQTYNTIISITMCLFLNINDEFYLEFAVLL